MTGKHGDMPDRIWAWKEDHGDVWTGEWSPDKDDDHVPADAVEMVPACTIETLIAEARKAGWKACLDHLMQGGSQTGCDFHNADGRVIGRFHGFFPAGATADEKAAHYEELAKWERAIKHATPMSFPD